MQTVVIYLLDCMSFTQSISPPAHASHCVDYLYTVLLDRPFYFALWDEH